MTSASRSRGWLHLVLLVATAGSLFGVFFFAMSAADYPLARAREAGVYTLCMLAILGAHEMGHYVLARRHGVDSSLPYFIPLPLGFGTLGAVIRLRGRMPSRNALVDIGAAGPLAGLVVAVPLLFLGYHLSRVDAVPLDAHVFPSKMSLWHFAEWLGRWLKSLTSDASDPGGLWDGQNLVFGDSLLTLAAEWVTKGPLPPGQAVYAHPVLVAAWFGLLMTMLNLMPLGQLDGGHLTHAWLGARAVRLGRAVSAGFLVLALLFSASWLGWFIATNFVIGLRHPPVERAEAPLSRGRKALCVVCFVFLVLCFMPVPLGV